MASVAVPRRRGPVRRDEASRAVTAVASALWVERRPTVDDGHGVMAEVIGDPRLRDADAPEQERPQRRVDRFQRLGVVDQQPARDDLVERPEPRHAGQPRVDRRDRAGGHGLVEIARDHRREPVVERVRLGVEDATRAHRVDEQETSHRAMTGEREQDRPERRIGAGDRLGLLRHRAIDLVGQPVGGRPHELAEDRLLRREVEVDPALARVGSRGDLVDRGVPVAAPGEGMERGVEDLLATRPTPFRLGRGLASRSGPSLSA